MKEIPFLRTTTKYHRTNERFGIKAVSSRKAMFYGIELFVAPGEQFMFLHSSILADEMAVKGKDEQLWEMMQKTTNLE
jgi:hypothetical protein